MPSLELQHYIDQLNTNQRSAVLLEDRHVLVVSQPGSGKTRTTTTKAAYLCDIDPTHRVMCVTFTRDAAGEMRQRIRDIAPDSLSRINTGNFHSLALRQLENNNIKYEHFDEHDRNELIRRVLKSLDKKMSLSAAVACIEHFKTSVYPPESHPSFDRQIYEAYEAALNEQGVHDYHDMLLLAVRGMLEGRISPYPCHYLLVDEFQDCDPVQYAWIMAHVDLVNAKVTAVGDDDQSIYGWRSAMGYQGMEQFERTVNAKRINLDMNYRSRDEILSFADRLILNNAARLHKRIQGVRGGGGTVNAFHYDNRDTEIAHIAMRVKESPHDWVVLSRTNQLLGEVEAMLTALNIPVQRIGAPSIWDSVAVSRFFQLLMYMENPETHSILRLLRFMRFGEKRISRFMSTLVRADSPEGEPVRITIDDALAQGVAIRSGDELNGNDEELERLFNSLAVLTPVWMYQCRDLEFNVVITSVLSWLGKQEKRVYSKQLAQIEKAARALKKMPAGIGFRERYLYILDSAKEHRDDCVRLMTLHSSKGLEFERVWIIGVEEDILPHADTHDPDEERRLAYVGFTRAKDQLIISCSGDWSKQSRYLFDAKIDLQHVESIAEKNARKLAEIDAA